MAVICKEKVISSGTQKGQIKVKKDVNIWLEIQLNTLLVMHN